MMDLYEELNILICMHEKGMISHEEYKLQKKAIEQEIQGQRRKLAEFCGIKTNRIEGVADEKTPVFWQKVFNTKKGEETQ